jgi:long-chain acyl-CoA synthetase
LGPDAVEYVVNHSALQTIVCSAKTFPAIAACIKKCPSVKRIIIMDALESKFRVAVPETLDLYSMADVQQRGEKAPRANVMAKPDDIYTIMYTSGTTGNPKGVIITHRNIVSAAAGLNDVVELGADDVHISYLPLAHIYELVCQLVGVLDGCAVGFWRGDVAWLLEDIQALKPTILVGVPRVFNRIYDKVLAQINEGGFIKKSLFQIACSAKTSALDAGGDTPIWNKLVFEKIRQAMGGRVRLISSGSAPIGAEVQEFLRLTSGAKVVQGYGLTESCAALTVQQIADSRTAGHVGPPLRCNEVKLVDVPEMGYTSRSTPQRGEICVRGNNIFSGYYKEKEKTDEVLEPSGWFHTGDIGEWLPNGTLKVIDRKKNIVRP